MRAQGCLNPGEHQKQLENTASVWFATRTPSEFSIAFAISPRVEATLGSHWSMPLAYLTRHFKLHHYLRPVQCATICLELREPAFCLSLLRLFTRHPTAACHVLLQRSLRRHFRRDR